MDSREKNIINGKSEPQTETETQTADGAAGQFNVEKRIYVVTAYCGCVQCCGKSDKITASGAMAVEGVTVATDSSIPFGSKIIIDGKEYIAQDRGGAIKGNRIDIYFESHERALQYGRQTKEVTILKGE